MKNVYLKLLVIVSKENLSQFEHYKLLSEKVLESHGNDCYILFTDDDDIWHEARVETYHNAILEIGDDLNSVICIKSSMYIISKEFSENGYRFPDAKIKNIITTNHVVEGIKSGIIETCDSKESNGEYWEYCVPLKYLIEFTTNATNVLINHKYRDVCFVKFITTYHAKKKMILESICWLYFYRHIRPMINVPNIGLFSTIERDVEVLACRSTSPKDAYNNYKRIFPEYAKNFKLQIKTILKSDTLQKLIYSPLG